MGKHINLSGKQFGRLVVKNEFVLTKDGRRKWLCECSCGRKVYVTTNNLTSGHTKSCGCWNEEVRVKNKTKHGMSKSRIYKIWENMKSRCECESRDCYKDYGGRGISLCEEWHDFRKFMEWAMEIGYRENLSIDRINNDGDYCPKNCRWTTMKVQGNNTRACKRISVLGVEKTMSEWENVFGLSKGLISSRIIAGWSPEKAVLTPTRKAALKAREQDD